jgi:thymidylate synthase ThyX
MIEVNIIKDSINLLTKDRLTTFVLKFPRFINAEILRHRSLSFSSSSSRAVPVSKMIESVEKELVEPLHWGKNKPGMQADEELSDQINDENDFFWGEVAERETVSGVDYYSSCFQSSEKSDRDKAKILWRSARNSVVVIAKRMAEIGVHKQIANRILEPFQNITLLVSGTEWENFFALRANKDAQPEFRILAEQMLEKYNAGNPNEIMPSKGLKDADFHIPFEENMPQDIGLDEKLKIAAARCARVSYLNQDGEIDKDKDIALFDRLVSGGHWSPLEHIAFPIQESTFVGNFKGWTQFRKLFPQENKKDARVIKKL